MKPCEVHDKYSKDFKPKIEEMDQEKIREIFEDAVNAEMPAIAVLPYNGGAETVSYDFRELTALCPMTGVPDTYTVRIEYVPKDKVPELKSLRNYFLGFRYLPIIHELLMDKIYNEFNKVVAPEKLSIKLEAAIRGGIKTTISKSSSEKED